MRFCGKFIQDCPEGRNRAIPKTEKKFEFAGSS